MVYSSPESQFVRVLVSRCMHYSQHHGVRCLHACVAEHCPTGCDLHCPTALLPALPYCGVTCTALLWCYLHCPIVVLPALPYCGITCTALLWCWAPTHRGVNCTAPPCCYLLWPTVLLPALPHPVLPALPHRSATCMAPLCCYLHCPTGCYLHCPTRCYLHCHTPSSPMILTCRPSLCSLDVYI